MNRQQQDSPVPHMPCEQNPWQPTPGQSGTQWSEDLFPETSQHNEPPIPGPSQPSEPHEDSLACGPEAEVPQTQSMEESFARPATPASVIMINNTPIGSAPLSQNSQEPWRQAPLIPKMNLARNLPSYNQP
ncbi:hypothetical protein O181_038812 [Austropuccinia psidii MF-1]|uniref:Uncharacterized protein n=1 Tax=Austropuccinia psidii MF-1 TaxID=1389203 RepID=A0A9Q3DFH4_9BASI|nr:hypothetical protein [Austropuccinia psidii MF-1]